MQDYTNFKNAINGAIQTLSLTGKQVTAKKWARQSPFQKARYKPEYVYPEVWVYRADGGSGAVVTGDAIKDMTPKDIVELITNYLH